MTFSRVRLSSLAVFVAAVVASACGSSSPNSPSGATGMDLTGAWTGTIVTVGSNDTPDPATWTATQVGANSTGAFGLTVNMGAGVTQKVSGTLAGAVSGTQVIWALTFPAGSLTALGSAACSISGSGTSSGTTTSAMTVTMNLTFSQPCVGVITDAGKTTEVDQLTLKK